jgi:hypothetical protein
VFAGPSKSAFKWDYHWFLLCWTASFTQKEVKVGSSVETWLGKVSSSKRLVVGNKPKPHQPAVLLWFVNQANSKSTGLHEWKVVKGDLARAIRDAGGSGSPESPIGVLTKNGILTIEGGTPPRTGSSPEARMKLNAENTKIGLPNEVWLEVTSQPEARKRAIEALSKLLQ